MSVFIKCVHYSHFIYQSIILTGVTSTCSHFPSKWRPWTVQVRAVWLRRKWLLSCCLPLPLGTPLKLLSLLGLLLQWCNFCFLTLILVKIKVWETMDFVSITIIFRIFPYWVEQHAPNLMGSILAGRAIHTGTYFSLL